MRQLGESQCFPLNFDSVPICFSTISLKKTFFSLCFSLRNYITVCAHTYHYGERRQQRENALYVEENCVGGPRQRCPCTFSHDPLALMSVYTETTEQIRISLVSALGRLLFTVGLATSRPAGLSLVNSGGPEIQVQPLWVPGSALSRLGLTAVFPRTQFQSVSFRLFASGPWKTRRDLSLWGCSLFYCERSVCFLVFTRAALFLFADGNPSLSFKNGKSGHPLPLNQGGCYRRGVRAPLPRDLI